MKNQGHASDEFQIPNSNTTVKTDLEILLLHINIPNTNSFI